MGREFHEHFDDVELERYHPGCMGGIFNVLDNHHWYNVKKMLPHRKYNRGRHTRCCANPQTISMEREPVGTQGLLDGEAGHIQVQQQTRKTGSTNKSSGKASTKGLTGKEKPKEENHKHWISGFSARPQSQQDGSTHHLEPSGFGLGWMNPIILIRKKADNSDASSTSSPPETLRKQVTRSKKPDISERVNTDSHLELEHKENSGKHASIQNKFDKGKGTRTLTNQKPMSKKNNEEVSYNQVKEGMDVLEIFKINQHLFLDILQDPEVGISQHFPGKQTPKTAKLTKSGSFPLPDSPRTGYLRSGTLEHKQKEVWSFRKGEKALAASQLSKSRALRTDDGFRRIITEEASSSSQGYDSQRWNHLVMNRLKDIKKRIKQALKERRKSINHTMVDGHTLQVSSRDTITTNEGEMSGSLEKTTMEQDRTNNFNHAHHTDASDPDTSNGRRKRIRRTKSIDESLDRYTQLLQHSVSKEADLHHSKSLKLPTEDKVSSRGRAPKFFRRISSLSDLESFCSLLHEVSRDALSSEMPIRSILNYDANKESDAHNDPKSISFPEDIDKFELVEAVIEAELQKKMTEGNNHSPTGLLVDRNSEEIAKPCGFDEDIIELAMEKSSPHQEQETVFAVNPSRELAQPTSDLKDITSGAECSISEGLGLNRPNLPQNEAESFTFLKDHRRTISRQSVEYETVEISSRFLFFESDKEDDPCYNYVRDVLELSGFIQNDCLQTWYSPDQPLNPSLFKELETFLHDEPEYSVEEVGSNCDHQLVFDLVNEALLEISEKSPIYFPKPFSFNCRISPVLKGDNVLQEVWTKVSRNLASQPESDQSLDDIVARDLAKDAWLNLQAESEFVALELEDLIFDELLDEVLCL
ncbi:protein TRM32-like [Durio zibethinus]|uniref:Protein TRM32-like n=1 Tax=Durio zibethinus TaxID=66656 RepID=A0A6P5XSL7_DURZI|nr:protein TRM32-like [Durio zibethinus]XP_022731226.1 protein TRM32-like [Durio zibethinus]XP_022731227.1 protein TRM32-like [Durio zibethinus]XP_022731228.1 protein TRM32-like [Durio zibethinus]